MAFDDRWDRSEHTDRSAARSAALIVASAGVAFSLLDPFPDRRSRSDRNRRDGNCLVAILRRKLQAIEERYTAEEWPRESLFAVASIYGVELLDDNHRAAKATMLAEFLAFHQSHSVVGRSLSRARRISTPSMRLSLDPPSGFLESCS